MVHTITKALVLTGKMKLVFDTTNSSRSTQKMAMPNLLAFNKPLSLQTHLNRERNESHDENELTTKC